jgi:selenide,water dikinase
MALHSGVRMRIFFRSLPLYEGAVEMYDAGVDTGSNEGNRDLCGDRLEIQAAIRREEEEMLFDPQTSGGLLVSLPEGQAVKLVEDLHDAGVPWAAVVGQVSEGTPGIVVE